MICTSSTMHVSVARLPHMEYSCPSPHHTILRLLHRAFTALRCTALQGYSAAYARLANAVRPEHVAVTDVPDVRAYFLATVQ